jgi:hypothetical protein
MIDSGVRLLHTARPQPVNQDPGAVLGGGALVCALQLQVFSNAFFAHRHRSCMVLGRGSASIRTVPGPHWEKPKPSFTPRLRANGNGASAAISFPLSLKWNIEPSSFSDPVSGHSPAESGHPFRSMQTNLISDSMQIFCWTPLIRGRPLAIGICSDISIWREPFSAK